MNIRKTLYVVKREDWRRWLKENHDKEPDIWLVFYKKESQKPRLSYNDAVEEALCFGWIDSIVKKVDQESFVQRFSPRKPNSQLSELNKERIRKLMEKKLMTKAGIAAITKVFDLSKIDRDFEIPRDILKELKKNKTTWRNFLNFPKSYQRIRIGWIDGARERPEEFQKRLEYFLRKTEQGKLFGTSLD